MVTPLYACRQRTGPRATLVDRTSTRCAPRTMTGLLASRRGGNRVHCPVSRQVRSVTTTLLVANTTDCYHGASQAVRPAAYMRLPRMPFLHPFRAITRPFEGWVMGAVVAPDGAAGRPEWSGAGGGNTGTRLPPAHRSSRIGRTAPAKVAGLDLRPSLRSPASRRWRRGTNPPLPTWSDSPGRSNACWADRTSHPVHAPGWHTPGSHCHACTSWRQHNARPNGPPS